MGEGTRRIEPASWRLAARRPHPNSSVTIILPTANCRLLETALGSVIRNSTYHNYGILVIDNSVDERVGQIVSKFAHSRITVRRIDQRNQAFNFSKLCNQGVAGTGADFVMFLNDDITVITPGWVERMLNYGENQEVGAVGCQFLYADGRIQHAGIAVGIQGLCGHPGRFTSPADFSDYGLRN